MSTRQRAVISLSVPPETAAEYRKIAHSQGETISQFFREMFEFYKREKLKKELYQLQDYGASKTKALKITEREIEKLIFEGR
jgi:hypothetical protein